MLRVDFTFDKKIIEKNGYTMSNIYETIKMEFDKKNISCVAEGEVLSFGAGEKKNDFSDMWTIIMRLTRSKWFLNYATSCTWNENNKSEDVLIEHRQYSVYTSKNSLTTYGIVDLMEKLSQKLPWLYLCMKEEK